jgi:uncharacterized protein (TIGR02599 family)
VRAAIPNRSARGFTLVEMLVSMTIVSFILFTLVAITDSTSRTWRHTTAKVEQFRDARVAFEAITRRLSQATLNTYWDYEYEGTGAARKPVRYVRRSELRFISGPGLAGDAGGNPAHATFFQAPLGLVEDGRFGEFENLLNTWGYFITFSGDKAWRPPFIKSPERFRFRLMELMEPSDALSLYKYTGRDPDYAGQNWFTDPLGGGRAPAHVLADNVLALVLLPKLSPEDQAAGGYNDASLAPRYRYDSTQSRPEAALNPKNQLPPVVRVTMVVIDERSASRLADEFGSSMPALGIQGLFQNADDYERDLKDLEKELVNRKLSYRVFTTNVSMRGAKWSSEQAN